MVDAGLPCVVGCVVPDAGVHDAGPSDGAPPPILPALTSFVAHQSGRSGGDLLLTVTGTDANKTAFGLDIQLGDKNGQPVSAFRNWAGTPTTYKRIVLFDGSSAVGSSPFSKTVTLAGFMGSFPLITTAVAAAVDTVGESPGLRASVVVQTVDSLHQACDPKIITDRCGVGYSCDHQSSTCLAPAAPQLAQFAYVTSPAPQGARVLFAGTDPADDVSSFFIEFLDGAGNPAPYDLNGDGSMETTYSLTVGNISKLGAFFYSDQTAQQFSQSIPQLAATPMGSSSGAGTRVTAMLKAPPVAATGAACDLRGFAACATGSSCVASTSGGASTCVVTTTALTNASASAPALNPSIGVNFVTGYATGTNLWGDPPVDCVPTGVRGFPEGIVRLHLADATPTLTLTTDHEETTTGVAIFVLNGQGAAVGSQSLGCAAGAPATVTLTNLAAGDYTVVLGSTTAAGGDFGLSIE